LQATAAARNAARGAHARVPDDVLQRLAAVLEAPTSSGHPWDANTALVDTQQAQQQAECVEPAGLLAG
jgi:hypothetical protein